MSATAILISRLKILLWISSLAAVSAAFYLASPAIFAVSHGLLTERYSGTDFAGEPQSRKVEGWIAINSNEIRPDRPVSVRWSGFVWIDTSGDYEFIVDSPGLIRLSLDGAILLDVPAQSGQIKQSVHGALMPGAHSIALEFRKPALDVHDFFHVNLRWKPPGGWEQDVPGRVLFPYAPSSDELSRVRMADLLRPIAGVAVTVAIGLMLIAGVAVLRRRITRRQAIGLTIIYSAAILLRVWYLSDLQAHDPFFNALPPGTDHRGYESQARRIIKGTWPDEPFYFQPGQPFYLALIHGVAGEDLFATRAAQAALGSLGVAVVFCLARAMFNERAGWIAAGLYAVYPVFIFYDVALVAASGATLFMLLALAALAQAGPTHLIWAFAAGLIIGLGGAFQPALITGAPVALAWPLVAPGDGPRPRRVAASALVALGIVAGALPFSLWTSRFTGQAALYSHSPQNNFYIGNNHQSNGGRVETLALQAVEIKVRRGETTYAEAMTEDIRAHPVRFVQLLIRKFALMWSNAELPNLVDYDKEGRGYSLSLRFNPLNFAVVATLAFAGFILTFRQNRNAWLLLGWAVALSLGTALAFVTSRQRVPIIPPLIVLAGVAIDGGLTAWRSRDRSLRLRWIGALAMAILASLTLAGLATWLPRPPVSNAPPRDGMRTFAVVGDSVKVIAAEQLPPVYPGQPVFIPVYWQVARPLDRDYAAFAQLIDAEGNKWAQGDIEAGATSNPGYPTSQWRPGQVVRDEFLLVIPDDMPTPLAAWVYVGLYDPATGERLPVATEDGAPLDAARIGPLSINQRGAGASLPSTATPVTFTLGDSITLRGYQVEHASDSGPLTVTLFWNSLRRTTTDYVVFIHVFDPAGQLVAQDDRRPRAGNYPTNAWQGGELVEDAHRIDLPANLAAGAYRVEVGLYRPDTLERLPVTDAGGQPVPDDSIPVYNPLP